MDVELVDAAAPDAPRTFVRSMHRTGFAVLVNHGIDDSLIQAIYSEWLAFFCTDAKHSYRAPAGSQEGFFPHLPDDEDSARDFKEYFQLRPAGCYPAEVSGAASEYYGQARALAARLLEWLEAQTARSILDQLPVGLVGMLAGSTASILRVQHYLPLPAGERLRPLRALAHTDLNLLTVLPAPTGPGLQVCDTQGTWHDIPGHARSIVINGGEMLELATGLHYPATPHRVVNPPGTLEAGSRMSLPLFFHPASASVLAPGVSASSFLKRRVSELRMAGWRPAPGGEDADT